MPDTLAQLTDKIQATLLDDGTLFPDANVTAAVRLALLDINRQAPQHHAEIITTLANTKVYELNDADPAAGRVVDVFLEGTNEDATPVKHSAYVEDGRFFLRLADYMAAGKSLDVIYTKPHTISGLDAATESTFTDELNVAAISGGVHYCCLVRAARNVETNNVEPSVSQNWLKLAETWGNIFAADLKRARLDPVATADTAPATWEDPYHSTEYP